MRLSSARSSTSGVYPGLARVTPVQLRRREIDPGRVAWVSQLNPDRGQRLLATFAEIDWSR